MVSFYVDSRHFSQSQRGALHKKKKGGGGGWG